MFDWWINTTFDRTAQTFPWCVAHFCFHNKCIHINYNIILSRICYYFWNIYIITKRLTVSKSYGKCVKNSTSPLYCQNASLDTSSIISYMNSNSRYTLEIYEYVCKFLMYILNLNSYNLWYLTYQEKRFDKKSSCWIYQAYILLLSN